jgi:hypothetical protein
MLWPAAVGLFGWLSLLVVERYEIDFVVLRGYKSFVWAALLLATILPP